MSDTTVSLLTPPGSGAIATVEVVGSRAWELVRRHFRPAGSKPLPDAPPANRFWYGTFAGDEVVLVAKAADRVEIHCHGGRRVVLWVMEQFEPLAALQPAQREAASGSAIALLPFAPTLRTASILLDQHHGAFDREVRRIISFLDSNPAEAVEPLRKLASFAPVGRHLVEPWKVVVAGPPNVGKSSLVNALAGFRRSVVSEVAGTTRDAVGIRLAFDGWPVELIDTAGLRESEGLEAEGIAIAEQVVAGADLVLWVLDRSDPKGYYIPTVERLSILIGSKADLPLAWPNDFRVHHVSTVTGDGLSLIAAGIPVALAGVPYPAPGDAVPFTRQLADAAEAAHAALEAGNPRDAASRLRAAVGES